MSKELDDLEEIIAQLEEEGIEITSELIQQVRKQYQAKSKPKSRDNVQFEKMLAEKESLKSSRIKPDLKSYDKDEQFQLLRNATKKMVSESDQLKSAFGRMIE